MNKLERLIVELCPDGVKKLAISEICDITRGRVMSKDYIKENAGDYPVYSSQTENNGELGRINTYDFEGEYLTWTTDGANAGTVFYRTGQFSVTNVCGLLKVKEKEILTKYLYYTLNAEAPKFVRRGMGNPKLMSNVMAQIKVYIPPIEIQNEIIHILDNLTELAEELTTKLTEEHSARKKQYEYYRDSLLSFDNTDVIKKVKLNEICQIYDGTHQTPNYTDYGVKFASVENITNPYATRKFISVDDYNKYKIKPQIGDVLMTRIGSIGVCYVIDKNEDLAYYVSLALLRPDSSIINSRYLKHYIESIYGSKEFIPFPPSINVSGKAFVLKTIKAEP